MDRKYQVEVEFVVLNFCSHCGRISLMRSYSQQPLINESAGMIANRRIAGFLRSLGRRWWGFFIRRGLAGFPWFWPARPPGQHAMVEARRMVRRHYGRDHDPVRRKLAQVFVTIA